MFALERILSGYKPLPGIFDEMMDRDGRVRAHWRPFLSMLAALGAEEINRRFAVADRHLRELRRVLPGLRGSSRRRAALAAEPCAAAHRRRPNGRRLKAGLMQRAALLEAVLADVYGPAELVATGRLPATLDRRQSGIPAAAGRRRAAGRRASALLRGRSSAARRTAAGGCWATARRRRRARAMRSRTGSRSSRALPDIYRALQVERLAPFFQALQAELVGAQPAGRFARSAC